jgi:hypothetical protein
VCKLPLLAMASSPPQGSPPPPTGASALAGPAAPRVPVPKREDVELAERFARMQTDLGWGAPVALPPPSAPVVLASTAAAAAPGPGPALPAPLLTPAQAAEIEAILLAETDATELGLRPTVPLSTTTAHGPARAGAKAGRVVGDLYALKRVQFGDASVRIVLQNVNGPCALIAIGMPTHSTTATYAPTPQTQTDTLALWAGA